MTSSLFIASVRCMTGQCFVLFRCLVFVIGILSPMIVPTVASAQYSSEAFSLKKATDTYDERGYAQNGAVSVDGKLIVSHSNGNISYSYPISSTTISGYPLDVSLNYCGSVAFTAFREYDPGDINNPYSNWSKFHQNRPAWIVSVNNFAVQVLSSNTMFHCDPSRFLNANRNDYSDSDLVWLADGYDFCNRMGNLVTVQESNYGYVDMIRLLRGDGSILELVNRKAIDISQPQYRDDLYTGHYYVNGANEKGFGVVTFDTVSNWPDHIRDLVEYVVGSDQRHAYRPRILRYYDGSGLEYIFREHTAPYGMHPYAGHNLGNPTRFGGMKAGPTIFYLEKINSNAGMLVPTFVRSRHYYPRKWTTLRGGNIYDPIGNEVQDSSAGRALITEFDGVKIGYGDVGMTIEAYGRTTKVRFQKVQPSGNATSTTHMPLATRGLYTQTTAQLATLNETGGASASLYESYLGYVTEILDPEGRVTTFEYEPYTRHYEDYNFPVDNPPGNTLTLTCRNQRLKKVTEPTAYYTINYAPGDFMSGYVIPHSRIDNVFDATLNAAAAANPTYLDKDNYGFYQNNVASYVKKYERNGTLLTTQECEYQFLYNSGFFFGRHRMIDNITGKIRTTENQYEAHHLDEPVSWVPIPRFTELETTTDSADVVTITSATYQSPVNTDYLWLPMSQTTTVDGIIKGRQSFTYHFDTARTFGGDADLAAKFGVDIKKKITHTLEPVTGSPWLRDTTEYVHFRFIDTTLTRIDTLFDKFATRANYERMFANDSIDEPFYVAQYDPRIAVFSLDSVVGRNMMPPIYGLPKRQVVANAGGYILGGKEYHYFAEHTSPHYLNDLFSRGTLVHDSIINEGATRKILGGRYDYTRFYGKNWLRMKENANGAKQRYYFESYSSPKLRTPLGAYVPKGKITHNDNTTRDTLLPHGGYFSTMFEKPLIEEAYVRKYTPSSTTSTGAVPEDTLLQLKQYSFHGLTSGIIDYNGHFSQVAYDKNGRVRTVWSPYDFPRKDTADTVTYAGTEVVPLYGSSRGRYEIDTIQCTDSVAYYINGIADSTYYENLYAGHPATELPDCPCLVNAGTKEKDRSHGILVSCNWKPEYVNNHYITGKLTMWKDSASPLRNAASLDSVYLALHPTAITGQCVTLTVEIPLFSFSKSYLFNCDSVPGGFTGEVASNEYLKVDLLSIKNDLLALGTGYSMDIYLTMSTVGGGIEFVNGINGEDTGPALVLKGTFEKPSDMADYTLAYTYRDDSLRATENAKIDDIAHTSNIYDLAQTQGSKIRRTTSTHHFGADSRVLKTEDEIRTGNSTRIDSVVYAYTGTGAKRRVKDQEGDTASTKYDALGRAIEVVNADGSRSTITYKTGAPATFGFTNTLDQDFKGFVSATITTNENGVKFVQYYDAFDKLRREIADSGDVALNHYNLTTRYNYDEQLRLTEVISPAGDTTFYWYDEFGRVRQKRQPDLGVISYTYDKLGNVRFSQTQEQADRGRIGFNQYDDLNRVTVIGEAVLFPHLGSPIIEDDGLEGGWLHGKVYTADGLIISNTKKEEEQSASILTGPITRVTDLLSGDSLKLGTRANTPPVTANPTLWETPQQGVPAVWSLSQTIYRFCTLQPDTFLLETGTPPTPLFKHPVTFYAAPYTPVAAMSDFEDLAKYPHFARIVINYDTLPHRVGPVWADFPSHAQWDSLMPKRKVRNSKGRETAIAYREHGGEPWHYQVLSYDERGRVEALVKWTENIGFDGVYYQYNSMNQVIALRVVDFYRQYQTWYGFDANGRVDTVWSKLASNWGLVPGPFTTSVWRDPGQLTRPDLTGTSGSADSADIVYRYTKTGQIDSMLYPRIDVLVDYAYNHRKWLDSITSTQGGSHLWKQVLTYDSTGQITKQLSDHGPFISNPEQHYSYDNMQRLTRWRMNADTNNYLYDAVGNRTLGQRKLGGLPVLNRNTTSMYGGAAGGPNRLLSSLTQDDQGTTVYPGTLNYSYDGNGGTIRKQQGAIGGNPSQKWEYVYSYRGLMRRIAFGQSGTIQNEMRYRYSPAGEREQKRTYYHTQNDSVVNYGWVYYLLGGRGEQLAVYHGQQTKRKFCQDSTRRVYMYPAEYLTYGVSGTANFTTLPTNERRYVIADHLGSTRVVLDSGGMIVNQLDYEPFGKPIPIGGGAVTGVRKGFIDREMDRESGTYNMGERQLDDPRFLSIDAEWEEFRAWTPYHYSLNNPLVHSDPSGRNVFDSEPDDQTSRVDVGGGGGAWPDWIGSTNRGAGFNPFGRGGGRGGGRGSRRGSSGEGKVQGSSSSPQGANRNVNLDKLTKEGVEAAKKISGHAEHLKKSDLTAAQQEAGGKVVARKSGGDPYDHIREVTEAQRGLRRTIDKAQYKLGDTRLSAEEKRVAQATISRASKLLDYSEKYVPRNAKTTEYPEP